MYQFLRGTLHACNSETAVVEVHGVGYRLLIPPRSTDRFPPTGSECLLYTSFVVRELSQTLYGFLTEGERDLFECLITISGVGPKIAIALIGHLSLSDLHASIRSDDATPLCKVPGIGKKSANRILVEMRDKIPQLACPSPTVQLNSAAEDAVSALINLGYTRSAAEKAVEKALASDEKAETATLITKALSR
jgi:holliday junction DNA helicase RuvA